jgi:hypothetical protein
VGFINRIIRDFIKLTVQESARKSYEEEKLIKKAEKDFGLKFDSVKVLSHDESYKLEKQRLKELLDRAATRDYSDVRYELEILFSDFGALKNSIKYYKQFPGKGINQIDLIEDRIILMRKKCQLLKDHLDSPFEFERFETLMKSVDTCEKQIWL